MDPFAVLRVSALKYRKESDLPKLKEHAKKICKEYGKTNKHNKIKEVEAAYQQIKQKITQECNSAGAKAFNRLMVNRPPAEKRKRPEATPAPKPPDPAARASNPAEAHFLKVQGAASASAPQGPQRLKSREEQIREKAAARRGNKEAREEENAKRRAAIQEKAAAKRRLKAAAQGGAAGAGQPEASPPEASPPEASPPEADGSPPPEQQASPEAERSPSPEQQASPASPGEAEGSASPEPQAQSEGEGEGESEGDGGGGEVEVSFF